MVCYSLIATKKNSSDQRKKERVYWKEIEIEIERKKEIEKRNQHPESVVHCNLSFRYEHFNENE
jgi:hypothetical protein